jgi:hypothetical protein
MIQNLIDNLLQMLFFLIVSILVFRIGLKKSFKNKVGLFYEGWLILFGTGIIGILICFYKILFLLMDE